MKASILFIFTVALCSCTTNAEMNIKQNNSSSFAFETSTSDGVSELIRALTGASNTQTLFDKASIENSFKNAGISLLPDSTFNTTSISLLGETENISSLISRGALPISLQSNGSEGELIVVLNDKTIGALFSLMGEDAVLYTELLFAPLFTGEKMSADEYLEFMASLYGPEIKADLENSIVSFTLHAPQPIKNTTIFPQNIGMNVVSGNSVIINLSLLEVLVTTSDIELKILW